MRMGLKQKLVGFVGIVALAGGLAFGGLVVADRSGAGHADEPTITSQKAGEQGWLIMYAWPKKYEG